ncbi:MAG: hypothetical protein EH225_07670, partial [Calditrichaeota bacterium]
MRIFFTAILLLSAVPVAWSQTSAIYLSNLSANGNTPVYTTYAASMERSEFTLDEGYHFRFYMEDQGADFITDTGGDICLAFKKGASYVYEVRSLAEAPVIHVNYPDMVRYHYRPFPEIGIDATFLVYHSHLALLELDIKNESEATQEFRVIPFMHNTYRVFNDISFHPDRNAISFIHEELPDGWVLGHDIPYVNPVRDVFMISLKPDRQTSYRSYKWGHIPIPQQVNIEKPPVYTVWGQISKPDGERYRPAGSQDGELLVTISSHPDKILTSSAPRWGSADANINSYGFYGIELGNFGEINNGDVYTVRFIYRGTGQVAVVTDTVREMKKNNVVRNNIELKESPFLPAPAQIDRDIWGSGTEMRLYWKYPVENVLFDVYRRDYRESGAYHLIEKGTERNFFTDKNIQGDKIYGYIVIARDEKEQMSLPSREINNIAGSDFLTDIRYPDQIQNDVKDMSRVIAMPLTLSLQPQEVKHLRIIRGVSRMDQPQTSLMDKCDLLLEEELLQYQTANEKLFSEIPPFPGNNKDQEMLYWNAFNLMRQVMLPPEARCSYNYYVFSREPTWGWGHGGQVFHESLTMLAYVYMDPVSAMNSQRVYLERQHKNGYINYRTGPYLDETIPHNDQLTTSAPWYAWQNWEIYQITKDRSFLKEMYNSSEKFYRYYTANRDSDGDGLCEWGAHAVLESVRDARVAVWDEVGWPSNFEGMDLNCMLVMEAKALAAMARELGKDKEAGKWEEDAALRTDKINRFMWDEKTGFYYHVDLKDNDFTFK